MESYIFIIFLILFISFYYFKVYKGIKSVAWNTMSGDNDESSKELEILSEYLNSEEYRRDKKTNRIHLTIVLIVIIISVIFSYYSWNKWFVLSLEHPDTSFIQPVFCTSLTTILIGLYYRIYTKMLK